MSIVTKTGDGGKTSLMYGRRVSKTDVRVETYGTVDELNAALGMARASATLPYLQEKLLEIQKQLVALMGELAVDTQDEARYAKDRFPKLSQEMLNVLEEAVKKIESEKVSFDGWATPGASLASAGLDLSRTVCRRAERLVVGLSNQGQSVNPLAVQYLNRLSDTLWLMARYTETKNL